MILVPCLDFMQVYKSRQAVSNTLAGHPGARL